MRKVAEIAECQTGNKFQDQWQWKFGNEAFGGSMENIHIIRLDHHAAMAANLEREMERL